MSKTISEIIKSCEDDGYYCGGVLAEEIERMSNEEVQAFCKGVLDLQHHRDTTVGLWATDVPALVEDPKNVLFRIK